MKTPKGDKANKDLNMSYNDVTHATLRITRITYNNESDDSSTLKWEEEVKRGRQMTGNKNKSSKNCGDNKYVNSKNNFDSASKHNINSLSSDKSNHKLEDSLSPEQIRSK